MKSLIPQKQTIIGYEEELRTLNYAIAKNIAVLLTGETGVGKTSLIRHLAHSSKRPLRRVNLNGQTTVDEFVGKTLLNKAGTFWQDGVLIEAMRNGYWLVLDEVNAALPEILFVLHSLLDDDRYVVLSEKDGEVVRPHKNFRIFATMNPSGRYSGTKDLNKAFLSRFPMILQINFPEETQEMDVLAHYTALGADERISLVKMAGQLRNAYQKDDIEYVCSTRDLISVGSLTPEFGLRRALDLAVIAKVPSTDLTSVNTIVDLYFGRTGEAKSKDELAKINALNTRLKNTVFTIAEYAEVMVASTMDQVNKIQKAKVKLEAKTATNADATEVILSLGKDVLENYLPYMHRYLHDTIHELKDLEFDKIEDAKTTYKIIKESDELIHAAGSSPVGMGFGVSSSPMSGVTPLMKGGSPITISSTPSGAGLSGLKALAEEYLAKSEATPATAIGGGTGGGVMLKTSELKIPKPIELRTPLKLKP